METHRNTLGTWRLLRLNLPSAYLEVMRRNIVTPTTRDTTRSTDEGVRKARDLVMRYGWNATAYQIVNPGMHLWQPADGNGVVGFVRHAGARVVAGAPVAPADRLADIAREFEDDASRSGERVCYFGAERRLETALVLDRRHSFVLLGAQPVWRPEHFLDRVAARPSLRAQVARARNKGVEIERWDTATATGSPRLQRCLDDWLATRMLPPLHFLVEPNTLGNLEDRRVMVAMRSGRPVAFLVASPVPTRNGWLIEQIVRGRDSVNGVAEMMLVESIRDMALAGAEYVTLGLSPLSRRCGEVVESDTRSQPTWLRFMLGWVRLHGARFYNFEGLDFFKAKFGPEQWDPIYAIVNRTTLTPRDLVSIAGAFAGGSVTMLLVRGTWRALMHELRIQPV